MKVFPSIVPGRDEPFVDNKYSRAELERMDWNELRSIAKEHPSDEINGHSERETIEDFLEGETRL